MDQEEIGHIKIVASPSKGRFSNMDETEILQDLPIVMDLMKHFFLTFGPNFQKFRN